MISSRKLNLWKILLFLSIFSQFTPLVLAHDYWIEAENFISTENAAVILHLQVGSKLVVEEERVFEPKRTVFYKLLSAQNILDLRDFSTNGIMPVSKFNVGKSGTYLIGLERNTADIVLDSKKFNDYLQDEDLTEVIKERAARKENEKFGYERYRRFVKALIQVGDKKDKTYQKILGFKLEIIPVENPYNKKVGDSIKFKILFNGKPLKDTTVFAFSRPKTEVFIHQMQTNNNGECRLKIDRQGFWLVRLVKMERCQTNCEETDWESYWGSLSFAIGNS